MLLGIILLLSTLTARLDVSAGLGSAYFAQDRIIEAEEIGLHNPAGLAFVLREDVLLLVDRGGDEPGASDSTQIAMLTLYGEDVAGVVSISTLTSDPINMAFDV